MALGRAHTSARVADVAKLLLVNKAGYYTYPPVRSKVVPT